MVKRLMRTGLRRGLLGGSRPWLVVGAGAAGLRIVRRLTASKPEVVYSEELVPGTTLLISHGTDREPEIRTVGQ